MQYHIITTGERLWSKDIQASLFETTILSGKIALDSARAGLLSDIQKQGQIYAR